MRDDRGYVLADMEFDVVWEHLTRTGPPPVLRLNSPGRTHGERGRVRAAAWQALRDRGLADATGPEPGLVRLLHALARPTRQLELRACWGDRVRAVAAGRTGTGALAVRRGDTVVVAGCAWLPAALLGALPPGRPGPGRACTVPTAVLADAGGGDALVAGLVAGGISPTEARLLGRILGSVERRAQVVALVESAPGRGLHRQGGVIGLLDGAPGRYLLTHRTAPDGTEWTTVAPCDPRRLQQRLAALLRRPGPAAPPAAVTRRRSRSGPPPLPPPRPPR